LKETPNLEGALERLAAAARSVGLPFAIIGGLAVILRGYDRATQDVDALVMQLDEHLEAFVQAAEAHGLKLRISNGVEFAKQNRVILLEAPDGTTVDVSMGLLPIEWDVVWAAEFLTVAAELTVPVVTPEDLIILKLTAGRKRDYEDVTNLLELYPEINRPRVAATVEEYAGLLESPELVTRMKQLLG